jgi:hypothetical protein
MVDVDEYEIEMSLATVPALVVDDKGKLAFPTINSIWQAIKQLREEGFYNA